MAKQPDDPPITTQELFHLHQIRIGKPETKQPRSENYRNPYCNVRFEKEKAEHKDSAKIDLRPHYNRSRA